MGEPAIPTADDRERAIKLARGILQDIRDDEAPSYPRFRGGHFIKLDADEKNEELDRLVYLLASTLDMVNTALQHACAVHDDPNGITSNISGAMDELASHRRIAECRAIGIPVVFCATCGRRSATCMGRYEDMEKEEPACDECCGHGNEDGACHEIDHPALVVEFEAE